MWIVILFIVFTLSSPVIVLNLSKRSLVRSGKVKDKGACKCKTTAVIKSVEDSGELDPDTGRGKDTKAYYEFEVNGVIYHGVDDIYPNPFNTNTVTVLFDPHDPDNNCTRFGKRQDNGTNYLIALGIVFGVIAVIMLLLVLIV